jgi:hypothetical protein
MMTCSDFRPSATRRLRVALLLDTISTSSRICFQSAIWAMSGTQSNSGRQPLVRHAFPATDEQAVPFGSFLRPVGQIGRSQDA